MVFLLHGVGVTFVERDNSKNDSAHACDFSPEAVIEGGGYAEDYPTCCSVVEGVSVDIYHRELDYRRYRSIEIEGNK